MADRKTCVRCGRTIDGVARICPFCNWNQDEPVEASAGPGIVPGAASHPSDYVPPADDSWRKPVFGGIGAVVLLVAAFTIGAHVHGGGPPARGSRDAPVLPASSGQAAPSGPRANVTLVPDDAPGPAPAYTSAPVTTTAQGLAAATDRADATAVSSAEYAQLATRARAEQQQQAMAGVVDPRLVKTNAYGDLPRPRNARAAEQSAAGAASQAVRTAAVPESQPLPELSFDDDVTARVAVTVGADGRVINVDIVDPLPANNGPLLEAVRSWRFRPATINGVPVASKFSAAISFRSNG